MAEIEEHLRRWLAAGAIDPNGADRIRRFEGGPFERVLAPERPGVLEVLVYLGVIVAGIGAAFLVGQNWDELDAWARISAVGVPGVLALFAGLLLIGSKEPPLERAGHMAWLVSVALLAGTVLVAAREVGGAEDLGADAERDVLLLSAIVAVVLSLALWVLAESHPQVITVAASVVLLGQAAGQWPDDFSPLLAGGTLFLLGAAGLIPAALGLVGPGASARAVFGALAVAGPYEVGLDGNVQWAELLTFAVAAALVGVSVMRGHFSLTVVGVGGLFVALVTYVFEHFEDEIGAPVALIVSGGTVVAGVLLLVQLRGIVRQRRALA